MNREVTLEQSANLPIRVAQPWVVLVLVALGCTEPEPISSSKAPVAPVQALSALPAVTAAPAGSGTPAVGEFFTSWLRAHGETNVIADADGVGVAGNGTRLRLSPYGTTNHGSRGVAVDVEFRVRLPSGGEIVEYVAGGGPSAEAAMEQAKANFVATTFHVIYRGFINSSDPHQIERSLTIDGSRRSVIMGDIAALNFSNGQPIDFSSVVPAIENLVANTSFSSGPHWIKIVYAQAGGRPNTVAVTMDNVEHMPLTAAVRSLSWPNQPENYVAKQFIVVR